MTGIVYVSADFYLHVFIYVKYRFLQKNSWYLLRVKINLSHAHQSRFWYLVGVLLKISDKHSRHVYRGVPLPRGSCIKGRHAITSAKKIPYLGLLLEIVLNKHDITFSYNLLQVRGSTVITLKNFLQETR